MPAAGSPLEFAELGEFLTRSVPDGSETALGQAAAFGARAGISRPRPPQLRICGTGGLASPKRAWTVLTPLATVGVTTAMRTNRKTRRFARIDWMPSKQPDWIQRSARAGSRGVRPSVCACIHRTPRPGSLVRTAAGASCRKEPCKIVNGSGIWGAAQLGPLRVKRRRNRAQQRSRNLINRRMENLRPPAGNRPRPGAWPTATFSRAVARGASDRRAV